MERIVMINLKTDEAYALDYLAILWVKFTKLGGGGRDFIECYTYIGQQIGAEKMAALVLSDVFSELYKTNAMIFDIIDQVRRGEKIPADLVDELNIQRWKIKRDIQEKFFGGVLSEVKNCAKTNE